MNSYSLQSKSGNLILTSDDSLGKILTLTICEPNGHIRDRIFLKMKDIEELINRLSKVENFVFKKGQLEFSFRMSDGNNLLLSINTAPAYEDEEFDIKEFLNFLEELKSIAPA